MWTRRAGVGSCALILMAADAGASDNGLLKPEIGLMIWTWISFLVLLYILGRFAYRPLMFMVEQREKRIRDSLREAEDAKKKAESIAEEREDVHGEGAAHRLARVQVDRGRVAKPRHP